MKKRTENIAINVVYAVIILVMLSFAIMLSPYTKVIETEIKIIGKQYIPPHGLSNAHWKVSFSTTDGYVFTIDNETIYRLVEENEIVKCRITLIRDHRIQEGWNRAAINRIVTMEE
jgi:hypothetical protein